MEIAYLTTDEVNQELAVQFAEDCGATLYALSLCDPIPNGEFDALLYDWDCLSKEQQQEILSQLFSESSPHWVGLHSYNLDDELVEALTQKGVAVFHCLAPEVFQTLGLNDFPHNE